MWPIITAVCIMLLRVIVRCAIDATSFERTRPERGHQLFRAFFIAPDLVILALALLVSTGVLKSILAIHGIDTSLGDSYLSWFVALVVIFVVILAGCIGLWYMHHDDDRALVIRNVPGARRDRQGQVYSIIVWEIDWRKSSESSSFQLLIVLANILSAACIAAYAWFISFAFT